MGTLLKRSLIRTAALECAFLWLQAVVPASAGYLQTPVGSFVGTHARERMSYELAPAGDVNGDGYADFMMGTFHSDFGDESQWKDAGSVYLVLGRASSPGWGISAHLTDAHFVGSHMKAAVGWAIAGEGDVNGDGLDDMLIGAVGGPIPDNPDTSCGYAYLVLGRRSANWGHHFVLEESADASFHGERIGDRAGFGVDIIGDLNGDGRDEFIISADNYDGPGVNNGRVYLFKGKSDGWQRGIRLADADAIFTGSASCLMYDASVSGVGDVNGDAIPDFAFGDHAGPGRVFLFFGRREINWGKSFVSDQADVIFTGEGNGSWTGWKIARAGDVNGDGLADFLICANRCDSERGRVYLIFGKRTGWASISLSEADVIYSGEAIYDEAGKSARGGGDVNGDGFSDFIIGAANVDRWDGAYDAGKAYLLMGHAPPWTKWISLGDVQDSFVGERANDYNGYAVSLIGDFNRDGSCDFASSAPYRDAYPVENLGMVYLFFGDKLTNTIQGSAAFWAGAHIPGVKLKVNGDSSGVTDASGEYMLGLRRDRDYMVVPERTSGEADRECAISSYDAAVVARHAVGYESMSQAQCAVADVNGDEFIRFDDAMLIARSAVGIGNGSIGTWVFSPPSRSYPFFNADQLGQNFSGRIMGDVDSSWTSGLPKAGGIRMFFSIDTRPDSVFMTCSVESERPFLSFDLSVRFDEASLRFKSVEQTGLGKGFTVLHALHGGVLAVGGFRTEYASGAGNFVRLSFLPKGSLPPGLPQPVRAQIDGIPISTITTLSAVHKEAAVKPQWTQAFPNPFNQNTACTLRLHEDGLVIAEVYDAGGRRVRTLERGIRLAGAYGISWDGTNDSGAAAASGVYLLRVRTENADLSQKVLYLR